MTLSGNRLAFVSSGVLRMLDLSTGSELDLPGDDRIRVVPAIDGDRMVWMEASPGRRDIVLYDLTTGERQRINRGVAGTDGPAISGNRVVWRGEGGAVLLYEIQWHGRWERRRSAGRNGAGAMYALADGEH